MGNRFEKIYGAVLLLLVAALVIASMLYGPQMWKVKALIAVLLLALSLFFFWDYRRTKE
ncbi:MAG: hypothetical protein QHH30_06055 [candidate division NC10 bacterium]|nr:hypothetical protein [candidate division NC10 bacterium]